jgi:hypothetical protein
MGTSSPYLAVGKAPGVMAPLVSCEEQQLLHFAGHDEFVL